MGAAGRVTIRPLRTGRVIPRRARGLRAAVVTMPPGGAMAWHSTRRREELITVLAGRLWLETLSASSRVRRWALRGGQCAFIGSQTMHRILNRSSSPVRYLYVTGSA